MTTKEKAEQVATRPASNTANTERNSTAQSRLMVSGFGQFHTNEADPDKPSKKLTPYAGIDLAGIRAMVDTPQQVEKAQAQWLIPSTLPCRAFEDQRGRGSFLMLWADLDEGKHTIKQLAAFLAPGGFDYEIYTSRSATEERQKARILIPISKPLCGGDWLICQELLNDTLQAAGIAPDRKSEGAAQLCYLPNRGGFYDSCSRRGEGTLNPLSDWGPMIGCKRNEIEAQAKAQAAAIVALKRASTERREALSLTDAQDTIGAFNHAFPVQEILLRAGYAQRGETFRHPQSESGSYSASVKDGRVHSLSSNDPLYTGGSGGGAHDAFSCFTVLYCGGERSDALKLAGDQWLMIGGESWNKVKQRQHMQAKAQGATEIDVSALLMQEQGSRLERAPVSDGDGWPEPQAIPCQLLPVMPFDNALLPVALRAWVADIADRMQCPPDFPAVGAMVALSSVIGRKAGIKPKRHDDWLVIPNLWGAIVGRPGVMKSPALSEVLKPLDRLSIAASDLHAEAMRDHEIKSKLEDMGGKAAEAKAQKLVSVGKINEAERLLVDAADAEGMPPPVLRRYKVTDASVEALGEILMDNPWGTLAYRDELNGLLRSLDKEGQEGARAFYLQGYDGNQGYTFDRIMRGRNRHIEAVCIAMLGGIQPGKLQSYIRDAVGGGAGDDGLLQRFGLLVWPDVDGEWRNIDRWPDTEAKRIAFDAFERLDALVPGIDAESGKDVPAVYRFSDDAQPLFEAWRLELETALRSGEHHPAMESHLSKYRKLVPAIALVCALADGEREVSADSVLRALAWTEYVQSHAERAYAAGTRPATDGATALLAKIRAGTVEDGFKPADVYLKGWTHLGTPDAVHSAACMLCDLHHLRRNETAPGTKGGRPSTTYQINPATMEATK